ncbi:UNVERIFIED_CONTAM: hypothetical protein HDU68_008295 [Siphonaria sp. JEL0065]|nr:hypothetical protein HDU68_008295 [Siphonaria sp. JEL0065]
MLIYLRLDQDPEDSDWLMDQKLSDFEIDSRRRVFWILNYSSKILRMCIGSEAMPHELKSKGVKPMHYDVGNHIFTLPLTPETTSPVYYLCTLLDVTQKIANQIILVPKSFKDLIKSSLFSSLKQELDLWLTSIPDSFFLTPKKLIDQLKGPERSGLIQLTMFYRVSVCVLHRPCFYLTGHLSLKSKLMTPDNMSLILEAMNASVSNALDIAALNSKLLSVTQFLDGGALEVHGKDWILLPPSYWKECIHIFFALFESSIVLWFFLTKTKPYWWKVYCFDSEEKEVAARTEISEAVLSNLRALRLLEAVLSNSSVMETTLTGARIEPARPKQNLVTPMVDCVTRLVQDMEGSAEERELVELYRYIHFTSPKFLLPQNTITIEMDVLSVGKPSDPEKQRWGKEDPWVFMGLLGAEVKGTKWRAPLENEWREFWRVGK